VEIIPPAVASTLDLPAGEHIKLGHVLNKLKEIKKIQSKDEIAENQRRYYEEHKDEIAENQRRYREEHKDNWKEYARRRKERKVSRAAKENPGVIS
jgi:hypothetical protein